MSPSWSDKYACVQVAFYLSDFIVFVWSSWCCRQAAAAKIPKVGNAVALRAVVYLRRLWKGISIQVYGVMWIHRRTVGTFVLCRSKDVQMIVILEQFYNLNCHFASLLKHSYMLRILMLIWNLFLTCVTLHIYSKNVIFYYYLSSFVSNWILVTLIKKVCSGVRVTSGTAANV